MDEIANPNPRRRRRNGRGRRRNRGFRGQRRRASRQTNSGQLLTGHGRTVLGQRLTSLHRQLAAAAERYYEISHDRRPGSVAELEELEQRVMALAVEINQIEGTLELAEHPELEIGQSIGPGSAVEVIDAVSGQRSEYRLVGAETDNDSTVVGAGSIVGQALLGRRPGSVLTVAGADGPRRVQIAAVRPLSANGAEAAASGGGEDDG
jgi:transcription elongation GreA/GreB family factor